VVWFVYIASQKSCQGQERFFSNALVYFPPSSYLNFIAIIFNNPYFEGNEFESLSRDRLSWFFSVPPRNR
jgi:hypothetical protein